MLSVDIIQFYSFTFDVLKPYKHSGTTEHWAEWTDDQKRTIGFKNYNSFANSKKPEFFYSAFKLFFGSKELADSLESHFIRSRCPIVSELGA